MRSIIILRVQCIYSVHRTCKWNSIWTKLFINVLLCQIIQYPKLRGPVLCGNAPSENSDGGCGYCTIVCNRILISENAGLLLSFGWSFLKSSILFYICKPTVDSSKVCKSVHHHAIKIHHQIDASVSQVYYPDVYLQLNMFRASSRPSSGTQQLQ